MAGRLAVFLPDRSQYCILDTDRGGDSGTSAVPRVARTIYIVDPASGDGGVQWVKANAKTNPVTQRDLDAGFITVQNRLNGEALEEYITPVGGGFFFALPGVRDAEDWYGRALLA